MYYKLLQDNKKLSEQSQSQRFLLRQSHSFLSSFLEHLDEKLDKRLVRTFFNLFIGILMFRNRTNGLILSELGGFITGFKKAAAGTKRISNLLRSKKWTGSTISDFFIKTGKKRLETLHEKGKKGYFLWDDSVLEKHESWFSEGLCAVRSSKAKRITKVKRGYYRAPKSSIRVPGFHWSSVVLSAWGEKPFTVLMSWWTTRGKEKDSADNVFYKMLRKITQTFGKGYTHVLDRGYANLPTLERLWKFEQGFIIRWKTSHLLLIGQGKYEGTIKQTHLVARSFKAMDYRMVYDKERKQNKRISIAYAKVFHPEYPDKELYLVIARDKNHKMKPMYILTSECVDSIGMAWEILFAYMMRWNIEQVFRFMKTELAIESIRLWFWDNRLKLLHILSLVYDFIVHLANNWKRWVMSFTHEWEPRTGKRNRPKYSVPLYRFRAALSKALMPLVYELMKQRE